MEQTSKFKKFAGDWLPPKVYKGLLDYRTNRAHGKDTVGFLRSWDGEVLDSYAQDVPLFSGLKISPQLITFNREARNSVGIERGREIKIELACDSETKYRIGFGSRGSPKLGECAHVKVNDKIMARLDYVEPELWHDVWISLSPGKHTLTISHGCSGTVFMSHPTAQKSNVAAKSSPAAPRNVIVILLDAIPFDCIGLTGGSPGLMPSIERTFEKGLICTNAFSQSECTMPSLASMITGYHPKRHGLNDPKSSVATWSAKASDSLAVKMRERGFVTYCYSSTKYFSPALNSCQGFDRLIYAPYWKVGATHQQISRHAINQLEENRTGKNFLFLHFMETHQPWLVRSEKTDHGLSNFRITDPMTEFFALKRGQGETQGEVFFNDDDIATFKPRREARMREADISISALFSYLENSGQLEDSLVVLTSDHGFAYLQQKQPMFCDTRVHVPLLIRGPGIPSATYDGLISNNVDMMSTLLHLVGAPVPKTEGEVLAPLGGKKRRHVISESLYGKTYRAAVRDDEMVYHFQCAYDNQSLLVNTSDRPISKLYWRSSEAKCEDVSSEFPQKVKELRGVLDEHLSRS